MTLYVSLYLPPPPSCPIISLSFRPFSPRYLCLSYSPFALHPPLPVFHLSPSHVHSPRCLFLSNSTFPFLHLTLPPFPLPVSPLPFSTLSFPPSPSLSTLFLLPPFPPSLRQLPVATHGRGEEGVNRSCKVQWNLLQMRKRYSRPLFDSYLKLDFCYSFLS